MATKGERELLVVDDRDVWISNPRKVLFPERGHTKLDLVRYYLAVAEGALRGAGGRPNVLVRYPNGVGQEFFYQKRAPESRPDWIDVVELKFPSGRAAESGDCVRGNPSAPIKIEVGLRPVSFAMSRAAKTRRVCSHV